MRRGFTLLELTISAAVLIVMIGLIGYVLTLGDVDTRRQQAFVAVQDAGLAALNRLAREIRETRMDKVALLNDARGVADESTVGIAMPSARDPNTEALRFSDPDFFTPAWSRWTCYYVADGGDAAPFGKALFRTSRLALADIDSPPALAAIQAAPRVMITSGLVGPGLTITYAPATIATFSPGSPNVLLATPHTQTGSTLTFTSNGFLARLIRSEVEYDEELIQVSRMRLEIGLTLGNRGLGDLPDGSPRYNIASTISEVRAQNL